MSEPFAQQRIGEARLRWEVPGLRFHLGQDLADAIDLPTCPVVVPEVVATKVLERHSIDIPFLTRLPEATAAWRYAGTSPKSTDRIEIYARLDGVWLSLVLKHEPKLEVAVLITMHRIKERKLQSRL